MYVYMAKYTQNSVSLIKNNLSKTLSYILHGQQWETLHEAISVAHLELRY